MRTPLLFLATVALIFLGACAPISQKKLAVDIPEHPPIENYKLVPGDLVRIDVYGEPDMASEQRIAQDGTVNIALAGLVKIGALTTESAASAIEQRLADGFLVNPQVTVSILEYTPRRFTVIGQVNAPGNYVMPSEEFMTLAEAVAMAGGNTRIGNLRRVLISRKQDGSLYEIKVNLLHPTGRQFVIQEGDVITVPESLF